MIEQVATTESPPKAEPVKKPARKSLPVVSVHHILRKRIHAVCTVVFIVLPFFNVMRFDIPRQRFHFLGWELWINEFGIIFFVLMFLMFLIAAMSMLYGRLYCGYFCPQMIFSEASESFEQAAKKFVNKHAKKLSAKTRDRFARGIFYAGLGVASVFLSFVFISYFVEPRDLLGRLVSFDIRTAAGISGAATTLFTFLDFTLVRQRFCTTVCPYGYLQGLLTDDHTLIVHYRDDTQECINCKKCVKVCGMGIDIRNSPYQLECIHCGECIDACADILARLGKPGLIHYTWGEKGELLGDKKPPWYKRWGFRDAKRIVVLCVLLFYAAGLFVALSMRREILVQVSPDRTVLFRIDESGQIRNTFRVTLANRGGRDGTVKFVIRDLPGAKLVMMNDPIRVPAGQSVQTEFQIAADPKSVRPGVNHFSVVGETSPAGTSDAFQMTFIAPTEKPKEK